MALKIRPVGGKLLLQIPALPEEETRGGIVIRARSVREGYRKAIVKALPNGYRGDLEPGAEVLLPPFKGTEVKVNGETLVFVAEDQLAAAVEA